MCPLCDSSAQRIPLKVCPYEASPPPYVQCQRCGLVFHDGPQPGPDLSPLPRETYMRAMTWKLPTHRERLRWLLKRAPVRRGRAVDIGTKDGSAVKALTDMGWQAIGYDPDYRFHEYARETLGVDIRRECFTAAAVGPGTLELVVSYHVFEHIPDPQAWLAEVREALRPDGYLQIDTPNLRRIHHSQIVQDHVVLYTSHTLRQMLEKAGFRIVAVTEYAPGGNRTYDQLGIVAQRDRPRSVHFTLSPVDRAAPRSLLRPTLAYPPSTVLPVRISRGVRRRIVTAVRRIRYHASLQGMR